MIKGDVLVHKASGLKMVVLNLNLDHPNFVKCRFYNPHTGSYETQDFEKIEFEE